MRVQVRLLQGQVPGVIGAAGDLIREANVRGGIVDSTTTATIAAPGHMGLVIVQKGNEAIERMEGTNITHPPTIHQKTNPVPANVNTTINLINNSFGLKHRTNFI